MSIQFRELRNSLLDLASEVVESYKHYDFIEQIAKLDSGNGEYCHKRAIEELINDLTPEDRESAIVLLLVSLAYQKTV